MQEDRTGELLVSLQQMSTPMQERTAERSVSLRQAQTPLSRPVTAQDSKLQLMLEQIERNFFATDDDDDVISRALAEKGNFIHPSAIAKTTKPKAKKDKPTVSRMFSPQDTYFQFQKNSNVRLTARSKPALLEVSDRFCEKMVKYLEKTLRRADRSVLCLADVKHLMRDMGLLPENDPRNFHLFRACQDFLDYEDKWQVIPYRRLDMVPGSTSVPGDIWDAVPKEPTRRRRR
jgi:hypothetical protein